MPQPISLISSADIQPEEFTTLNYECDRLVSKSLQIVI
jgi:hypothetical protein